MWLFVYNYVAEKNYWKRFFLTRRWSIEIGPEISLPPCIMHITYWHIESSCIKGSLTRDFRSQVFFMNECPPGPQVFRWGHFEFFWKFSDIRGVSTTQAISCSAVSTTPGINPCQGFSVIASVIDTGDHDTGDKFIARYSPLNQISTNFVTKQ